MPLMAAAAKPALHEPEHLRGTTLDNLHFPKVVFEGSTHSFYPRNDEKGQVFRELSTSPLVWAPSGAQAQGLGASDTEKERPQLRIRDRDLG